MTKWKFIERNKVERHQYENGPCCLRDAFCGELTFEAHCEYRDFMCSGIQEKHTLTLTYME